MHKKLVFLAVLFMSCFSIGQSTGTPAPRPSTDELLATGKTFYVVSDTIFAKKEELEKGLVRAWDFNKLGLQVTQRESDADFIVFVSRAKFQNNFPFTVTHRATRIVVYGGEVNSLIGTVPWKIGWRLVDRIKDARSVYAKTAAAPAGNSGAAAPQLANAASLAPQR